MNTINNNSTLALGLAALGGALLLALLLKRPRSSSSPPQQAVIRPPPLPPGLVPPFAAQGLVSPVRGIPLALTAAMATLSKPLEEDQPSDRTVMRFAPDQATRLATRALESINALLGPEAKLHLIVADSAVLTSAGLTRVLFTAHSLASNLSLKLLAIFGGDADATLLKLSLASEALSGPSTDTMPQPEFAQFPHL